MNALSPLLREGCWGLRNALASICRMRSRVVDQGLGGTPDP
jgi:hypothetical protein